MAWMTKTSRQIVEAMLFKWIHVFMLTVYYVISVITLETLNTQDAHWPHRSSEKTVHKNMKTGQYVFTIS